MIVAIPGEERARFPRLIDEMHRLRRIMFHERLGWPVTIVSRWEIDAYDALNPLYVLALDENERVIGGLRLLPTTGCTMLNDSFSPLLPEGARIESPLIWESSRFMLRLEGGGPAQMPPINRTIGELGLALNKIGKAAALTHIVTVHDSATHQMLARCGCAGEPLAPPRAIGGVETRAAFYEVGGEWESRVRRLSGIGALSLDLAFGESRAKSTF